MRATGREERQVQTVVRRFRVFGVGRQESSIGFSRFRMRVSRAKEVLLPRRRPAQPAEAVTTLLWRSWWVVRRLGGMRATGREEREVQTAFEGFESWGGAAGM
jgi:hypothetical protein